MNTILQRPQVRTGVDKMLLPRATARVLELGLVQVRLDQNSHLGSGSYASVYQGWSRATASPVAVKVLSFDGDERTALARFRCFQCEHAACERLSTLRDLPSSLVEYIGAYEGGYPGTAVRAGYLVMPILPPTTLDDELGARRRADRRFSTAEALALCHQATLAVYALHANAIAHRDIKAENMAYDPATQALTLFDLGFAFCAPVYDPAHPTTTRFLRPHPPCLVAPNIGTPLAMAPEVELGPYDPFFADVWALGQVFYHIVALRWQFQLITTREALSHCLQQTKPPPVIVNPAPAPELAALIDGVLRYDWTERPAIAQVEANVRELTYRHPLPLESARRSEQDACLPDADALPGEARAATVSVQ